MAEMDMSKLPVMALTGIACITYRSRKYLGNRDAFVIRILDRCRDLGYDEARVARIQQRMS